MNQQPDSIAAVHKGKKDEAQQSITPDAGEIGTDHLDYIVFRLAGIRFALLASVAREVLRVPRMLRIPQIEDHILGVIQLRGQIVAVIDLRPILELPSGELPVGSRLIVIEASGILNALAVELVEGICRLPTAKLEELCPTDGKIPKDAATGQLTDDQGSIILLDLDYLLTSNKFAIDFQAERPTPA